MTSNLLQLIQESNDNSTTLLSVNVFHYPKKDKLVHAMLRLRHDVSGLEYPHLIRMSAALALKFADDLQTHAELATPSGPAF